MSPNKKDKDMVSIAERNQAVPDLIDTAASARLSRHELTEESSKFSPVAFVGFAVWRREENGDGNLSDEHVFVVRDGKARLLDPRNDLADCSDGVSWGYPGSGPAQLAVAMLMELLGDWERVQRIRYEFQEFFAARIPQARNWTADGADIMAIVLELERITLT
jgi:hypothetical protein